MLLVVASILPLQTLMLASVDSACRTVVYDGHLDSLTTLELRTALEKGTDEVKLDTLRSIIVSTMNGNSQV